MRAPVVLELPSAATVGHESAAATPYRTGALAGDRTDDSCGGASARRELGAPLEAAATIVPVHLHHAWLRERRHGDQVEIAVPVEIGQGGCWTSKPIRGDPLLGFEAAVAARGASSTR
jgi:hypothetical protein